MLRLSAFILSLLLPMTLPRIGVAGVERSQALRPFVASTPDALRARHAGRPWIMVLWSATCEPCRDELKHWARWQREHPEVPVEIVSTDEAADAASASRILSMTGNANGQRRWIFADEYTERLRHAIDPAWHGEVPRTYFFDARRQAEARSGKLDAESLDNWVAKQRSGAAGR